MKKMQLIVAMNPEWRDLSENWGRTALITQRSNA
jgi:hypothetical protein